MIEKGLLNRDLASLLSRMGHRDELIVCDAGFPIPEGVQVVDLSLSENLPLADTIIAEILKYFSVEKVVITREQTDACPAKLRRIVSLFGDKVETETIGHADMKARSRSVKGIVRSGDFSAYTNVLLVSGAGDRWRVER